MKIIYRACETVNSVNGLPRPWGLSKREIIELSFKSLSKAVENKPHEIHIIGDSLSEDLISFFKKISPEAKIESYNDLGNAKSLYKCFEKADSFSDDDLIYFCEDDYLHFYPSFHERGLAFAEFAKGNALDFFFHPSDYPDQYRSGNTKRSYIFALKSGHMREVSSTTFTFMCLGKTYKKHSELLKSCAMYKRFIDPKTKGAVMSDCGADDGRFSEIFGKEALCFSPLPGIATHLHVGTTSAFVEWDIVKEHVRQDFPEKLKIKI